MPFFSRGILFLLLLLLLLAVVLTQHSAAAALDAEERQKEEQDYETALKDESEALRAPDPPESIMVDPQGDTSVLVVWSKPSDTTDLDHYYTYVEGEDDMVANTTTTYYIWYDLQACMNYTFGVSSVSDTGDMSDPILGDGRTEPGRPPPPQNLQGESQSSTTMTLTWDKPDTLCDIDYYLVKWSLEGTNTKSEQTNETSFTVTELLPSTTYIFSVTAYTSYGGGDEASISETTVEDPGGPPEDLQAVGVSPTAINVSWTEPVTPPTYYTLQGLPCQYLEQNVFGLWYPIDGLEPCAQCSIYVTSVYDNGVKYTATTIGESLASDPPPPTSCSVEAKEGVITVRWVRPDTDCFLGKYHVQWTSTKLWGDGAEESNSLNTSATQYSITGPVPYSEYTFEISSSIEGVFGSPASCSGTSLETLPGPPVILGAESLQGEALVTWETPAEENGVIKKYGIFVDEETDPRKEVDGTEHSASVVDLTPCERVGLSVKALNSAGWGPSSDIEYVTVVDDVLPDEVNCAASDRVVEVCWMPYNKNCPVSRYNLNWEGDVLWSDDLVDSSSTTMNFTSTEICYNISAVPYTKYFVELSVGSKNGERTCTALTPMEAPGPPTEVNSTIEILTITVTWSEPDEKNGIIEKYNVQWTDSDNIYGSRTTEDNSTFSVELPEMHCGITVDITVSAKVVDVVEFGPESSAPTAYLVNSVDVFNCFPSEPRQISLNWTLVDDKCPVTSYNISWTYESLWSNDAGVGWKNVAGNDNNAVVESLPPYADVFLQIHVDNNPEDYVECRAITLEEVSSKPTSLEQIANETTSVTVSWGLPVSINGNLSGWILRWTTLDGDPIDDIELTDPDVMTYEITHLSPSSTYTVFVMALNGAGLGEAATTNANTSPGAGTSPNRTGLIVGVSVGGGILLLILLIGGYIFYQKKNNSKPPKSAPHMPEVADADSDELYKKQHLSAANQRFQNKIGSVDFETNSELYTSPRPSLLPVDGVDDDNAADNPGEDEITSGDDRAQMFGVPANRRFSQQVATSLPRLGAYNRRPSQQVNTRMRNYDEYNRRPSQQDMVGRPSLGEYGRRPSQQIGRPNLGEFGRRPSQQVDLGRPTLGEFGRRPSQQVNLGRPNLGEFGRRPSQQAGLGKPRLGEYGRRPSQQVDLGKPMPDAYGRRPSQQIGFSRSISADFARRPSQQLPSGGGSYPAHLPQGEPVKRSSADLYSRRLSQQSDISKHGDRMFMKRPSQQFVMPFDEIEEL